MRPDSIMTLGGKVKRSKGSPDETLEALQAFTEDTDPYTQCAGVPVGTTER